MQEKFPEHLTEIFLPTPSGVAKLLAVWDELSVERRIEFLFGIKNHGYPPYLAEKIYYKALESSNAYIRYLAARKIDFDKPQNIEIKNKVESDKSTLVKYSLLETEWTFRDEEIRNIDKFYALPHDARLAKV